MTNKQINIAIAEECGWKLCQDDNKTWRTPAQRQKNIELLGHENGPWSFESPPPPDYCNDLNAMHEAVTTLPENKRVLYGVRLAWECGHTDKKSVGLWHISTATAYHRAVAFLKTLEKWDE